MRAAVVQMRSGISRSANLEAATRLIEQAAEQGATLVLTPEMTTLLDRRRERMLATLAEPLPDEEEHFAALSQRLGIALVIGSSPFALGASEKVANRSVVYVEGRRLAAYDKVHLFDVDLDTGESWRESKLYAGGEEAVAVDLGEATLGLSICYDLRFPHLYRQLAQAGATILTVPAAFTVPTGRAHWEPLLRARAIETGSFVLAAAQGGEHEDGRVTYGHSMIISPWGEILDHLPHDEPGVAAADLDLSRVGDMRQRIPSLGLDRTTKLRMLKA
ncbi:MAG: carbon-nitrogen hydrolase family protein [Parvularculaceae bacterium]|nr:carbon-nitrogen hydrolase family protein [Parvularculaceae bacterium]